MFQTPEPDQKVFHDALQSLVRRDWPMPSVRDAVEGRANPPNSLLGRVADQGAFAVCVPEPFGGGSLGGDPLGDAAITAAIKGVNLQAWPCASVHAAAVLLGAAGTDAQQEGLADLASGECLSALPLAGDASWGAPTASAENTSDGVVVRGSLITDIAQTGARLVAVFDRDGTDLVLHLPTDGDGVTRTALRALDPSNPLVRIDYDGIRCTDDDVVPASREQIDAARAVAVVLIGVESVAAMETLFEMTRAYALDRTAFGRPIGSFQALKHLMADTSMRIEAAKAACWAALRAQRNTEPALAEIVGITRVFVIEQSAHVVQECLQVHGGIGYAAEHDLHLFLRRIMANTKLFGDASHHRSLVTAAHAAELGR